MPKISQAKIKEYQRAAIKLNQQLRAQKVDPYRAEKIIERSHKAFLEEGGTDAEWNDNIIGYMKTGAFIEELPLDDQLLAVLDPVWTGGFYCLDCDVDTFINDEIYMVNNDVWLEANPKKVGMLCIGCLEKRLGRPLTKSDFTDCRDNTVAKPRSSRLRDRMSREAASDHT